jgi:hypothetical protein
VVNGAGLLVKFSVPKVSEPAVGSSNDPPAYEGRIVLDPILLDRALLCAQLETGGFELVFNQTNSNLIFHHLAGMLHEMALLIREATAMVGRPFRPVSGGEMSLEDLTFLAAPGSTAVDRAEDEEERGSHSDPDQVDTGELATSD